MTAQISEKLYYKGKTYRMFSEPLEEYWQWIDKKPEMDALNTGCWRGYIGTWEIVKNKLYLIDIVAYAPGYIKRGLDYIFPGKEKVFAAWFKGELRLPQGELLKYVHGGYASIYERDLILDIHYGILKNETVVDNTLTFDPNEERLPF